MNKIVILFSALTAFLLINALPAFSDGTGPYGVFGPSVGYDTRLGVGSQHVAFLGGTGPYGVFGPSEGYEIITGGYSKQVAFSGGSGPYGKFGSYGMITGSESNQFANKDECLLVAMNCPPGGMSTQQRIDRLNTEIGKGTDVYTPEELKALKDQRDGAYRELNGEKGY